MESPQTAPDDRDHAIVMRAEQLQNHVLALSNGCHVRYWLHWNYPCRSPWVMAVECRQWGYKDGKWGLHAVEAGGMREKGFEWDEVDERYYINRDTVADNLTDCSA